MKKFFTIFIKYTRWESGKENLLNKNLPKEKQYLVTKGVPCEKRLKEFYAFQEENAAELERDVEDGWVETSNPLKKGIQDEQQIMDLDDDEDGMQVIENEK